MYVNMCVYYIEDRKEKNTYTYNFARLQWQTPKSLSDSDIEIFKSLDFHFETVCSFISQHRLVYKV